MVWATLAMGRLGAGIELSAGDGKPVAAAEVGSDVLMYCSTTGVRDLFR